jgi:hypothetical protein
MKTTFRWENLYATECNWTSECDNKTKKSIRYEIYGDKPVLILCVQHFKILLNQMCH